MPAPTVSTGSAKKGAAVGHLVPVAPVTLGLGVAPGLEALQSAGQDVVVSGPSQKPSPQHCLETADTLQLVPDTGGWAVVGLGTGAGLLGGVGMGLGARGGLLIALGGGLGALQSAGQDAVVSGPSQKPSPQHCLETADTLQVVLGGVPRGAFGGPGRPCGGPISWAAVGVLPRRARHSAMAKAALMLVSCPDPSCSLGERMRLAS